METQTQQNTAMVHLFSFDPRFCGSTEQGRRVTVKDHEVTCPDCRIPECDLCGEPMMLQEALNEEDELVHIECGLSYPQWACLCNGGHYRAATGAQMPANWRP